jgi:YD repeat-containing protein
MTYSYAYSNAGRINTQTISWTLPDSVATSATVQYQWDNQGKMTSLTYPGGQQFNYQYDAMGRLSTLMQATGTDGNGNPVFQPYAEGSYGNYGATPDTLTVLNYGPGYFQINEQMSYNLQNQLTGMTGNAPYVPTFLNLNYNYSSTANNGRVTSISDYVINQTVNYTYDSLNRLTAASAGSTWAEQYTYDGFGNLTRSSTA